MEAIIQDKDVRAQIFAGGDDTLLAKALAEMLRMAAREGVRFHWWGGESQIIERFLAEHGEAGAS